MLLSKTDQFIIQYRDEYATEPAALIKIALTQQIKALTTKRDNLSSNLQTGEPTLINYLMAKVRAQMDGQTDRHMHIIV